MAGRKWSETDIEYLMKEVSRGQDLAIIAQRLGRTYNSVYVQYNRVYLQEHGYRVKRTEWTDEETEQLRKLVDHGLTYAEIAEKMGRTQKSVTKKCYHEGIQYKSTGAKWTKADIQALKYLWCESSQSIDSIARQLYRTRAGIVRQAYALDLGYHESIGEKLKIVDVIEYGGIPRSVLDKWVEQGYLKTRTAKIKGSPKVVTEDKLLACMKAHQEDFSAANLTDYLFIEIPKWLEQKRADDKKKDLTPKSRKLYTAKDDALLIQYYRAGKSCKEIGQKIGRSISGVKARAGRLKAMQGKRVKNFHFTESELQTIEKNTPEKNLGQIVMLLDFKYTERNIENVCLRKGWKYTV